jgi:acetyl-CoA carboxylase biotin carboxyl carrier protein
MPDMDLQLVKHALKVARSSGFTEMELTVGSDSFSARLEPEAAVRGVRNDDPEPPQEAAAPETIDLKATLVGYYRPGKVPLEIGAHISAGEAVATIAALGISNDLESPATGEVVELLVEPNQPVEFGQVLARIKP